MAENNILEMIVTGPLQENCFVYVDKQAGSGFVIDPGWDPDRVSLVIKHHAVKDVTILLTHGHFDHISVAAAIRDLTGGKVYMSSLDDFLLGSVGGETAKMCGMGTGKPFKPDASIKDGDIFTAGSITLKAMATPGHTPGGISFYDGGKRIFVGDTLFNGSVGRVDFPRSSGPDLLRSITEVLYKLPDDTIVHCGHGDNTTIGREKRTNPFTKHPELLTGGMGSFL
jgi:glyoxylase-like metal-dependent hydrolase (beta-lactamase superfamily II)